MYLENINEFSPERQLEVFVKIQHNILKSGYSLEHHLETLKELPKNNMLRYYETLFHEGTINEEQYNFFVQNKRYLSQ